MSESASLVRLMAMLSPAFPVGSFSYSGGLESAVAANRVTEAESLADWIVALFDHGSLWNEAVLFAAAWRESGDLAALDELGALAEALAGSAERHRETMLQGQAFLSAAGNWPGLATPGLREAAYPVMVGAIAGANSLPLEASIAAYLHAIASNLIQAAIRLGVVGQSEGVTVQARVEPVLLAAAGRAACSDPDDLGAATLVAELLSMRHETQYSRLFRS